MVIAILGILAAILVPSILGYVDQANKSADKANARSVYTAANAAYTSMPQEQRDALTEGSYSSEEGGEFIEAINNFLGSSFEGDYIVTVTKDGVEKVNYNGQSYPETTGGAGTSTSGS